MKILLTSYNFEKNEDSVQSNLFYRMPPLQWQANLDEFTLDYSSLIFADSLIMDKKSFDKLQHTNIDAYQNSASILNIC